MAGGSLETELHLRAKAIIQSGRCIALPEIFINTGDSHMGMPLKAFTAYSGGTIHFDTVLLENPLDGFTPDCVATKDGRDLLIEVKVTHGIDDDKLKKIRALNIPCVELVVPRDTKPSNLEFIVLDKSNYRWVHETYTGRPEVKLKAAAWRQKQIDEITQYYDDKRAGREALVYRERVNRSLKALPSVQCRIEASLDQLHGHTYPNKNHGPFTENERAFLADFPLEAYNKLARYRTQIEDRRKAFIDKLNTLNTEVSTARVTLCQYLEQQSIPDFPFRNFSVYFNGYAEPAENCAYAGTQLIDAFVSHFRSECESALQKQWLDNEHANGRAWQDPNKGYRLSNAFRDAHLIIQEKLQQALSLVDCDRLNAQHAFIHSGLKGSDTLNPTIESLKQAYRAELADLIRLHSKPVQVDEACLEKLLLLYIEGSDRQRGNKAMTEHFIRVKAQIEYDRDIRNHGVKAQAIKLAVGKLGNEALYREYLESLKGDYRERQSVSY